MPGSTVSTSRFDPVGPIRLHLENGRGTVTITAADTGTSADTGEATVEITGAHADEVRVELVGETLHVIAPRDRVLGSGRRLDMAVTLPSGSDLTAKLGSADLTCRGTLGSCTVRTGSGDTEIEHLTGSTLVEAGSGSVRVDRAEGPMRVKSGSGDLAVRHAGAELTLSTGSGDVEIGECHGVTSVKTGSGDLTVAHAHSDVALSTGSGDLVVDRISSGRVQLKGASGDLRVGVPAGLPVWTDVTTISGRIASTLVGAGQPEPGEAFVEVRATTVSGDIDLRQL